VFYNLTLYKRVTRNHYQSSGPKARDYLIRCPSSVVSQNQH